jgi:putative transposase
VIEGALEGELDDYLGYGKHEPEGRDGGNSRNGRRAKTVLTDTGPVEISGSSKSTGVGWPSGYRK